ncbi:MAG: hypothetical protein HYV97_04865 [Bdellovibrio sp.]|nr:hypothetical protein [Bdellovibrio sp.]
MSKLMLLVSSFLTLSLTANAKWFCEEVASEKMDNIITSCGIGEAASEDEARKKALQAAFDELDSICERSIDCKTNETLIEPQRNDCKKEGQKFKCYRAVKAIIAQTKRRTHFVRGATLKPDQAKIDVTIKIDPRDLIKIDNGEVKTKPQCMSDLKPLSSAMLDISSQDKLENMVNEAVKIPYDGLCAGIHYKIMYIFARNGVKHSTYINFLMNSMRGIEDPSADERAYAILDYFHSMGQMEDHEWQTCLELIARTNKNYLYRLLPKIFFVEPSNSKQQSKEKDRIDTLVKWILDGKVGRPMTIDFDFGMEQLLRSLKSYKSKENPWAAVYAYEKFRHNLKRTNSAKLHSGLETLYREAGDIKLKATLTHLMAENVQKSEPSYELGKEIIDFIESFKSEISKLDDEEDEDIKKIKSYEANRQTFFKETGETLGKNVIITRHDYEIKSRTNLCIEYQIDCGDLVPNKERFQKLLSSKKSEKRENALELLIKMPKMAAKLENEIFQCIQDAMSGKIEDTNSLLKSAAEALAAIPTKKKEALQALVELALSSRVSMQYVRDQLGSHLEPFWVAELKKTNTRHHLVVIHELCEFKKLTKETCTFLSGMQKKESPYYIKEGIERALSKCN